MLGRFGYFVVAGAAIFAGMVVQGDIDLDDEDAIHRVATSDRGDRDLDRRIDRIVDRATRRIDVRDEDGKAIETDPAVRRALVGAVAELVRAEGSLASARMDNDTPEAVIKQAEQRRDAAKVAVERIADDAKAESRGNRDALRQNIRDEIRAAVRS